MVLLFLLNIISVLFYSEKELLCSPCYLTLVLGTEQNNRYYKIDLFYIFIGGYIVVETCD